MKNVLPQTCGRIFLKRRAMDIQIVFVAEFLQNAGRNAARCAGRYRPCKLPKIDKA